MFKVLLFIVLAAGVCWLAAERSSLNSKLEAMDAEMAKSKKAAEMIRGKYEWTLSSLKKFDPHLAQAIESMDADRVASLKNKPESKTWLQERIEGRANPLEREPSVYVPPAGGSARPTTSGSRLIR